MTFAEMNAPTGEWKGVLAVILLSVSITGWMSILLKRYGQYTLYYYLLIVPFVTCGQSLQNVNLRSVDVSAYKAFF